MDKPFWETVGALVGPRAQALLVAILLLAIGALAAPATARAQESFATPEEAVHALMAAAQANNTDQLLAIFGPDGKEILSSGDPIADRRQRQVILVAFQQRWRLADKGKEKEIIIGEEDWPFPIPLVKGSQGWHFDTAAGKEEILARRIGHNELGVIQVCSTFVEAQDVYAGEGHDGKPAGVYAQKIRSNAGRQDGLFWPITEGEKLSPLGELAAQAAEEGYTPGQSQDSTPVPFHGYFFRILTAQGPAAPGGAKSYIVDGDMTGGFALVAWPAEYGNSGVMTFMVNQEGTVYQKDLGPETATLASQIREYNPDKSWSKAE